MYDTQHFGIKQFLFIVGALRPSNLFIEFVIHLKREALCREKKHANQLNSTALVRPLQ